MDDVVLYEVSDGIAKITLNRPDQMNAWTGELSDELQARLGEHTRQQIAVGVAAEQFRGVEPEQLVGQIVAVDDQLDRKPPPLASRRGEWGEHLQGRIEFGSGSARNPGQSQSVTLAGHQPDSGGQRMGG